MTCRQVITVYLQINCYVGATQLVLLDSAGYVGHVAGRNVAGCKGCSIDEQAEIAGEGAAAVSKKVRKGRTQWRQGG